MSLEIDAVITGLGEYADTCVGTVEVEVSTGSPTFAGFSECDFQGDLASLGTQKAAVEGDDNGDGTATGYVDIDIGGVINYVVDWDGTWDGTTLAVDQEGEVSDTINGFEVEGDYHVVFELEP